jgi:isocitrate/isopropylmalate dehydrogenase
MEFMLVDAMTCRMVLKPESIDTIVATNLVSHSPHRGMSCSRSC